MQDLELILTATDPPLDATATYYTNSIATSGQALGAGEMIEVIAQVAEVPTSSGSATIEVILAADEVDPIASGYSVIATTGTVAYDDAMFDAIGKYITFNVPRTALEGTDTRIGLVFVVATAALTNTNMQFNMWVADPALSTNLVADHPGITEVTGFAGPPTA